MNYFEKLFDKNEKPLDNITETGGFAKIFRTIACIGDSLSSGEFEVVDENNKICYPDFYDYSWGQFMARAMGSKVYNFSRGGMTANWYLKTYADENDFWNKDKAAQCYIIAMGCNDVTKCLKEGKIFGTIEDVKEDYNDNPETFVGDYARIIARMKEISPGAKFFFVTMPKNTQNDEREKLRDEHQKVLYQLAEKFDNSYVIDLRKYAPVYDEEFKRKFYLRGHLNPMGYELTSRYIMSYMDYIIRHDMENFKLVGLQQTKWFECNNHNHQ